jgi:hypothetical protein
LHHDLAENVLTENLARSLGICEADGGGHINLDAFDHLQTDGLSTHFLASRPGIYAPQLFEEPGRRSVDARAISDTVNRFSRIGRLEMIRLDGDAQL